MSLSPKYTFLSWFRQGMATYIEQPDDPATAGTIPELTFGIELTEAAGQSENITQTMPLVTPQNIVGIREEAIIKTTPLAATLTHPASHVASIEFYDEDFPWRYTPAAPLNNKLRPWVWLMVLEEGEYTIVHHSNKPLAHVMLPATLPNGNPNPALQIPPDDAWAWAHVQVNQALDTSTVDAQTALQQALEENPDTAFARIISPRQLQSNTQYRAFLVPYFEQGRRAGLGEDPSAVPVLQAAWAANDLDGASKEFPFYYQWEFTTSSDKDFETLARKLAPRELDNVPFLTMNVEQTLAHFNQAITTNDATKVVELESALIPVGKNASPWPATDSKADADVETAISNQLNPVIDTSTSTNLTNVGSANMQEDIVVNVPPAYGKWYLDAPAWQSLNGTIDENNAGWIHQLNTDVRARALAGLGVQVIRKHQEEFMKEAWGQIGEVIEANKKINQGLLAREASYQLHQKLNNASLDTTIAITGNLHQKVVYQDGAGQLASMKKEIKHSNMSKAPTDSAFSKLRRPSSKQIKKLTQQASQSLTSLKPNKEFLVHINELSKEEINGAANKPLPYIVNQSMPNQGGTTTSNIGNTAVDGLVNHVATMGAVPVGAAALSTQETALQQATNPLFAINRRLLKQLKVDNSSNQDGVVLTTPSQDHIQPIMAAPEIKHPLYNYLKTIGQHFILPDLKSYGDNFVGILDVNQSFVEKFLVGANHEMGRELLWRGYPTDQRGTYFRQFWNVKDHIQVGQGQVPYKDITPIHTWDKNSPLGSHRTTGYPSNPLVLIVKGELIRANPDLVIYAHQAINNPTHANNTGGTVDLSTRNLDSTATRSLKKPSSLSKKTLRENPSLSKKASSRVVPRKTLSSTTLSSTQVTNSSNTLSTGTTSTPKKILNPTEDASSIKYPIFRAELAPDVVALGFDLDVATAKGDANNAGWYFMFKERPGKIKLGMDEGGTAPSQLNSINDLHWQHMPSTLSGVTYVAPNQSLNFASGAAVLASNAAELATHLYQAPLLLGIHATRLLP